MAGRRKLFWATKADACGTQSRCGAACGTPGLVLGSDRKIETDEWVQGLAINILMTDARAPDNECGYRPGGQGGHWSESFMNGDTVGTNIRAISSRGSVVELNNLLQAQASASLGKLVARGVAKKVTVTSNYDGNGMFSVDADIIGVDNRRTKVGVNAQRLANGWVWT